MPSSFLGIRLESLLYHSLALPDSINNQQSTIQNSILPLSLVLRTNITPPSDDLTNRLSAKDRNLSGSRREDGMAKNIASKLLPTGNAKHDGVPSELDFVIENMRQGLWRLNPFGIIIYTNPYL